MTPPLRMFRDSDDTHVSMVTLCNCNPEWAASRLTLLADAFMALGGLLEANGCDCDCGHHPDEHDDECEPCFACRVSDVVEGCRYWAWPLLAAHANPARI